MISRSLCRVHWLLHNLPSWFKAMYDIVFDYKYHRYVFTRYDNNELIDCFIVIRTSKRCFRCMVYIKGSDDLPEVLDYTSYKDSFSCAQGLILHAQMSIYNRKSTRNAE